MIKKHRYSLFLTLLCAGLVIFSASQQSMSQELTASVDRSEIAIDETLTLSLQYTGSSSQSAPNLDKLESDFRILSRQSGNQIFGDMSNLTSVTHWTLVLSPKKEGKLKIPVFSVANSKSAPLTITVTPVKEPPAGEVKDIFIETIIEKDSVYVQEQLILKYRLFYSVNIDSLEREPIQIQDVINEQLPDVRYNRKIKDKIYGIAEFNYALYPQTSGEFTIPALIWDVKVPKDRRSSTSLFSLGGRFEIKRLRTEAKVINVLPEADAFPNGKPWIPAKSLTLQETWSKDPSEFVVGEPITRTMNLKADGLMASQLPQVWASKNEGPVKVYADQADLKEDKLASGSISQRIESAAVVVSAAGQIQLPAVRVPWWNVTTNTLEYAELPARTLSVRAPEGSSAVSSTGSERSFGDPALAESNLIETQQLRTAEQQIWLWRAVSAVLSAILLVVFVRYFVFDKSKKPTARATKIRGSGSASYSALVSACKKNSANQIRQALLDWSHNEWPGENVTTLDEIGRRIQDSSLSAELSQLDRTLYAGEDMSRVNGTLIVSAIKSYLEHKNNASKSATLEEFYVS